VNSKLKAILPAIGLDSTTKDGKKAVSIGRNAAKEAVVARADDGINNFVDYTQKPALPGVYQATRKFRILFMTSKEKGLTSLFCS
jgi:hypothetical protein